MPPLGWMSGSVPANGTYITEVITKILGQNQTNHLTNAQQEKYKVIDDFHPNPGISLDASLLKIHIRICSPKRDKVLIKDKSRRSDGLQPSMNAQMNFQSYKSDKPPGLPHQKHHVGLEHWWHGYHWNSWM